MNDVDQMPQVTAQPIKFPDNERVAFAKRLQALIQPGAALGLAADCVSACKSDPLLGDIGVQK